MEGTEENQQVKTGLKDMSKKHQWARVSYGIRGCMLGGTKLEEGKRGTATLSKSGYREGLWSDRQEGLL